MIDFRAEYRAVKHWDDNLTRVEFRPWWSRRWRYVRCTHLGIEAAYALAEEHSRRRSEKPKIVSFGRLPLRDCETPPIPEAPNA